MNAPTDQQMLEILSLFALEGPVVSCEPYGSGHINTTRMVTDAAGKRYILQRISENVFKDIPALMENIQMVTDYLRRQNPDQRRVLSLVPAKDGSSYVRTPWGYWRVYHFVEGSICLQQPETPRDFYESAIAFGRFQQELAHFPVERLHETIPDFHHVPHRYQWLRQVLQQDPMGRASQVQAEVDFILAREQEMGTAQRMLESGQLPVRVTHNDTKLNNVLLDAATRKALCVIDLDTVMPGLSIFDFGDSIRFGAATAPEDTTQLEKQSLDLERFRVYTRGYLRSCPDLTETELEMLPMGARTITLECGMRFLTDYLDGDHYFAVHRPQHNLIRCRSQLQLVRDMERKWQDMHQIVQEERL